MLLIPEGALRLKGSSRAILELCDGERTVAGIVEDLGARFPEADRAVIEADVTALLEKLRGRGVLELT